MPFQNFNSEFACVKIREISQLRQIMHQIVYQRKIDSRLRIVERSWELHVKRRILNQTIRRLDRSEEKSGSLGGLSKTTYRLALRMTSRASSLPRNVVMLSRPLKRKGRSSCTLHLQAAEYVWQPFEPSRYRNRWVAVSKIRSLVYLRIARVSWKTVRMHPIVNSRDLPRYYTPLLFFTSHILSASLRGNDHL